VVSWLVGLLKEANWEEFESERQALQAWEYYDLFVETVHNLKREALYISQIHGEGHVERVLLHGAMLALRHNYERRDVALLLDACCYHDTGRVDDSVDHAHGARSARNLGELTGRQGQELKVLQAIVEAHSSWDGDLEKIIEQYHVEDVESARRLALLLKDADGLDRVRINDLDVKYLRLAGSMEQKGFAEWLFHRAQEWDCQAQQASKDTKRLLPTGLREAADHFGVDGIIFPLKGGEGKNWCVGETVFKPMGDSQQTDWTCAVLTDLETDGFRLPRYKRSKAGKWTHRGWTCCSWLDGEEVRQGGTADWLRVMWAGCAFQRAISEQPKPAWMGKYYSIYNTADLIAWGEMLAVVLPEFDPLFRTLMSMAASSVNAPCQLIHGDLSGNVLLHLELEPGIIDFSPYWRPFLMGPAIVAADALLWHQADESLMRVACEEFGQEFLPFVARGLAFRLATSNLASTERGNPDDVSREFQEHERALTILMRSL
jgi:hypothetical protein